MKKYFNSGGNESLWYSRRCEAFVRLPEAAVGLHVLQERPDTVPAVTHDMRAEGEKRVLTLARLDRAA